MKQHYDYIITGSGCAGLSLLMRMMQHDFFSNKQILVIDQSPKTENDRTWCFWEKENGLFESIVHQSWDTIRFFSEDCDLSLPTAPYKYKMLRGIDFYHSVLSVAKQHSNINFVYDTIEFIQNVGEQASVVAQHQTYTADFVFNSILFEKPSIPKGKYYLMQHFHGWVIETPTPAFNPAEATFMDFRLPQTQGTTFMYVMPMSQTKALVEYTLFNEQLLEDQVYETAIQQYIREVLKVEAYQIEHKEKGIIPMTNIRFPQYNGRIIHMGIAGGQAKGSSGYAFQFIQKRTAEIVSALLKQEHPGKRLTWSDKKFLFYDSVLLQVLHERKIAGSKVFADIFSKNPVERVFRFLDNETNLLDDLHIMNSVSRPFFLKAGLEQLLN